MKTSNLPSTLSGTHLRTYEKIFQHPASHNLPWRDVLSLFSHLGEVSTEPNGNHRVAVNGHVLILPSTRTKDVAEMDELMKLRHFIEHADVPPPVPALVRAHLLVVIDHQQARVFHTDNHGIITQVIVPHEVNDSFIQAHGSRDFFSGKEKAPPSHYFETIAKALKEAEQILIFGYGSGTSNEMEQFAAWLIKHHAELARLISGTVVIDEHHMSEAQLLAKAREFYAKSDRAKI